jgi:hypothetical protein
MSDASTFPLRDTPVASTQTGRRGRWARAAALDRIDAGRWAAAVALAGIVVLSALVVVIVADRPSGLSPTTHTNFFPGWMAGPLGGIWPGLTRSTTALRYLFTGAVLAMYGGYVVALARAPRLRARWVIAAVVAVHAIYLLAPPLALTDIFNYINYGRMEVVHHLNPYTTTPIFEPNNDPSYALSNWHQLLSPYGPLFTLMTFAVVPLGVIASFWAIKATLALASLGTIALIWKCARLLGRDPVAAVVLVGLNPVVLVWGLGGDHNDFLMIFFIVLGFYLLLLADAMPTPRRATTSGPRSSRLARTGLLSLSLSPSAIGAGAAFVTAAAIKASAAVLIPVVLASVLRTPRRLGEVLLGMAAAGTAVGAASLVAFGLHLPDLSTQSRLVTNLGLPNLLGLALGAGGETTTLHTLLSVALALALLLCCALAWRQRSAVAASGWATVALLVTLSWALPWYVVWVLPLAALSRSRRLRAVSLALGLYLVVAWAPASGILWNAIGFHPERTSLGIKHQRAVRELLN